MRLREVRYVRQAINGEGVMLIPHHPDAVISSERLLDENELYKLYQVLGVR